MHVVQDENQSQIAKLLHKRIRILSWLPTYTRSHFIQDLIAGITVGLTLIPQSIAYATIAEIPSHVGLYTALMGSFIYIIFGAIKQVSIGPSSILSLLTLQYMQNYGLDHVVLLTFLSGCIELLMGVLKFGFVVDFIPAPVMSAFTSATALMISVAQLKNIFGVRFKSHNIFDMITKLVTSLPHLKITDTILGFGCMIFLTLIKRIAAIKTSNARMRKALWFLGISRNAITVFLGSLTVYTWEMFTDDQPFTLAGDVQPGLPSFNLPPFSTTLNNVTVPFTGMLMNLGSGIMAIPMVATLANVAIAKKFSDGSMFDAEQEMIALGISNIMGSFVGAMPSTGAFTRSAVNDASNVQTPMGGLYAGTIIILALSYLTPFFKIIPKATIAAVLICAVFFMIEYQELPKLWRNNKLDFTIGLGTFILSLNIGVESGLVIGSCLSLFKLLQHWARPKIIAEVRSFGKDNEYLLVKPEIGFYYPAAAYFREQIVSAMSRHKNMPLVLDFRQIINVDYSACQVVGEIVRVCKNLRKVIVLNVDKEVDRRLKSIQSMADFDIRDELDDGCFGFTADEPQPACVSPLLTMSDTDECSAGRRKSYHINCES